MSNGTKWTDDQLLAIETQNCDLLVAAAAGSGKTAVLVQRIISKVTSLTSPVDIDSLLVVTFTNAAAAEMRERIGEAITKELDNNPDSKLLLRQLTLLQKASITTVHSFCLEVIRNNFHIINIDPNFRIADETEGILLKREAMQELFDNCYENPDNEGFLALVEAYGGTKSDEKVEEIVSRIYSFSESSPWPEKWLLDAAEAFNIDEDFDFGKSKWAISLLSNVKIELTGYLANMNRALEVIRGNNGLLPYLDTFTEERNMIEDIIHNKELIWEDIYNSIENISFGRLKTVKNADEEEKKYVSDIRKKVKEGIKKIQDTVIGTSNENINREIMELYPFMKSLSDLTIEFKHRYGEKKKERGIIDFSDIEHYALSILTETDDRGEITASETAKLYKNRFSEVMVDEYQDSNLVQEVLLSMVSRSLEGKPNRFMVGDVKQSIYRFRQAMPELFLGKYNSYIEGAGSERKITLYKNFRSRKEILEGVNHIFSQIMSENLGELSYTEREFLNPGAVFEEFMGEGLYGGPIELNVIENNKSEENDGDNDNDNDDIQFDGTEEQEEVDNIQLEARFSAKRIRELIDSSGDNEFKVFDKSLKTYRKVEYRDIVILLRATKNWSESFLEELGRESIPAFSDGGVGYFETIEIKTILSLLQIIDNPIQDIPLLAVLRSPIFAFTPEELIDIRTVYPEENFYNAIERFSMEETNALSIKLTDFLEKLKRWKDISIYTPVDEFLWQLFSESGYLSYVSAMPGGALRQANLKVLFQRARQFEQTSYRGLFNFINFINKLKQSNGDMGSAKILGENENVVRIMSIHKSKGLEFPVVIVAGAGKGFNMLDLRGSILYHNELGFGPDYVDIYKRYTYSSTIKEAIKTKMRLETLSEEMRVLYVAFTRAKEKLIITGCIKNIEKAAGRWENASELIEGKLSEFEILTSKCYLDWICPSVINHIEGKRLLNYETEKEEGYTPINWKINVIKRSMIIEDEPSDIEETEEEELQEEKTTEGIYIEELDRRLSFIYPYDMSHRIPAKLSVSEIKRKFNEALADEEASTLFKTVELRRPVFLQRENKMTGAEKGTIMHLMMQHIDFTAEPNIENIKQQIENMVTAELLTKLEASTLNIKRIQGFLTSSLGVRLRASGNIIRELPFSIELPVTEVYRELSIQTYEQETIMLQGVIDCFFEEAGEYVLLDYKTDYATYESLGEIKERYRLQLEYYVKAIERISGKRVKNRYIYLFSIGEVVEY